MTPQITVEQTTDEAYIKSVFLNPTIYAEMRDDLCPAEAKDLPHHYAFEISGFFLRVFVDAVPAGFFWLVWKGDEVEAHTALLENCRGRAAINATKIAIDWVFKNTPAKAITSYAWSDAPLASWLCRMVGMACDRTEPWPNPRNGKPVNISYYALKRPA